MRTKPCYLVVDTRTARVRKAQQSWPSLQPGEIVVKFALDLPEWLANPPLTVTEVNERALTIGVHVIEPEPEPVEA